MDSRRAEAIERIEELQEAIAAMRAALDANESKYQRALDGLRDGASVATFVQAGDAGESRKVLTETIQELQRRRHEARRVMLCPSDGPRGRASPSWPTSGASPGSSSPASWPRTPW